MLYGSQLGNGGPWPTSHIDEALGKDICELVR